MEMKTRRSVRYFEMTTNKHKNKNIGGLMLPNEIKEAEKNENIEFKKKKIKIYTNRLGLALGFVGTISTFDILERYRRKLYMGLSSEIHKSLWLFLIGLK